MKRFGDRMEMKRIVDRLDLEAETFLLPDESRRLLRQRCESSDGSARLLEIGRSEDGRPIDAVVMGEGPLNVSLIAGNHSDEPVGPDFLRRFAAQVLAASDKFRDLLEEFTFFIVPHTNPDGEAKNRSWIDAWPDARAYIRDVFREPPGRDLEFGYPAMRKENGIVGDFLRDSAPFSLHMSLHGMGFSEGVMLLIERTWTFRTQALRDGFAKAAREEGCLLHDHNRKGEKGFFYIEPGFSTTPEGEAMRWFFRAQGADDVARHFHLSSMEFVRGLGDDPLCLVTELPLFVVDHRETGSLGLPAAYLDFTSELPFLRRRLERGEDVEQALSTYGVRPLHLRSALRLQAVTLDLALHAVRGSADKPNN